MKRSNCKQHLIVVFEWKPHFFVQRINVSRSYGVFVETKIRFYGGSMYLTSDRWQMMNIYLDWFGLMLLSQTSTNYQCLFEPTVYVPMHEVEAIRWDDVLNVEKKKIQKFLKSKYEISSKQWMTTASRMNLMCSFFHNNVTAHWFASEWMIYLLRYNTVSQWRVSYFRIDGVSNPEVVQASFKSKVNLKNLKFEIFLRFWLDSKFEIRNIEEQ